MSKTLTTLSVAWDGRITRHRRDAVGNDLTADLLWCKTHNEPVWRYDDESYTCPQELIIQHDDGTHVLVRPPWENW